MEVRNFRNLGSIVLVGSEKEVEVKCRLGKGEMMVGLE